MLELLIKGGAHVTFSQSVAKWPLLGWYFSRGERRRGERSTIFENTFLVFDSKCSIKYTLEFSIDFLLFQVVLENLGNNEKKLWRILRVLRVPWDQRALGLTPPLMYTL